ncbi:MAG: shikimate dehydrogenase family protein [Candidatus Limimorpha sp.]
MKLFGLVGHPLKHSFSSALFNEKFQEENLDCRYDNFDLRELEELTTLLARHPELCGFNVTSPYKQKIIPYLNEVEDIAQRIGAVNTVRVKDGHLYGYNTDIYGFEMLLEYVFSGQPIPDALILGTGGASQSVQFVLKHRQTAFKVVSRTPQGNEIGYSDLNKDIMRDYRLIINATPVGTFPNIDKYPAIPYEQLTPSHFLIDLIYNPEETAFMKLGKFHKASVYNGTIMLFSQAMKSWEIWCQESD